MKKFFAAFTVAIAIANTAVAQSHCAVLAEKSGYKYTTDVTFGGRPYTAGAWEVDHSVIRVQFEGEDPIYWSVDTATLKLALMDWIDTALRYEAETGVRTIAIRDNRGQVYLANQTPGHNSEDNPGCFAHLLQ